MDISKTISVLETLAPLMETLPIVGTGLAAMLSVAVQVCKAAEGAIVSRDAYQQLARKIAEYATAVSLAAQSDQHLSSVTSVSEGELNDRQAGWMEHVHKLTSEFRAVTEAIDKRRAQDEKRRGKAFGKVRRLRYNVWHEGDDKEQLEQLQKRLDTCVQSFHLGAEVHVMDALTRVEIEMKRIAAQQAQEQKAIATHIIEEIRVIASTQPERADQAQYYYQLDLLRQELKPVKGARFYEDGMPNGCLPHTREKLLEQLRLWANDKSESCPLVFGLTGLAGTGKTTVSMSFCEGFDTKLPVISFFISRASDERRNPKSIIHTISYQIGLQQTKARIAISNALQNGRDITVRNLREQVEGLFITPLKAWEGSELPVLVVIDALDECDKIDGREGGELFPLIFHAVRQLSGRVKLLITSREEPEIMNMFGAMGLKISENSIRLQNIEDAVVKVDVEYYYSHYFRIICDEAGLDTTPWPSRLDFNLLVERTGKLFVYAALVIRLLRNPWVDPKEQLKEILHPSTSSENHSIFDALDDLYFTVLQKAVNTGDKSLNIATQSRVRNLVGTLVLLETPLNIRTISSLLDENFTLIKKDIGRLSAVLLIPDKEDAFITSFHPSFPDYILRRCLDSRFRVEAAIHHGQILHFCLAVMTRLLKRDICNIGDPSLMNADIEDLELKCNEYLPLELRYACEHWLVHLVKAADLDDIVVQELNAFCTHHLLHWIEVLSLLDKVSVAHIRLPEAIRRCRQFQGSDALIAVSLLGDAERVVETYDLPIRCCALQVYCSVLLFMPGCKLYEHTRDERMGELELRSKKLEGWSPLRQTLEGHDYSVNSVAYSFDGQHIASGSSDTTLRVWDAIAGTCLAEFTGHTGSVDSVAFSHDGTCIASGSNDMTVRVWATITGATLSELTGHSNGVLAVVFSPDGTRIASGSWDQTVRVWDATTGATMATLIGHTDSVKSIAFSPNGTRIVSGSSDKTVRVWDAITGATLSELTEHTSFVTSVAFSADGTRIVSGSGDKTVRVWDVITSTTLAKLTGHTQSVRSVAFSANGTRIASGSDDRTVRVWDAITGATLSELIINGGFVESIAFSPDGMRVASGSSDRTVRVWDAITGSAHTELARHTDFVYSVAFSADGTRIASGSRDRTVLVWDAVTGAPLAKLEGHTDFVRSVAFSGDGTRVVSGSDDKTVRVWDATTGATLATLEGHTSTIGSAAFSEDGLQIISNDVGNKQRVWHAGQHFPSNNPNPLAASLKPTPGVSTPTLRLTIGNSWLEMYQSSEDRWKRLCWVSPERRRGVWTFQGVVVLFTSAGQVTILGLSK